MFKKTIDFMLGVRKKTVFAVREGGGVQRVTDMSATILYFSYVFPKRFINADTVYLTQWMARETASTSSTPKIPDRIKITLNRFKQFYGVKLKTTMI